MGGASHDTGEGVRDPGKGHARAGDRDSGEGEADSGAGDVGDACARAIGVPAGVCFVFEFPGIVRVRNRVSGGIGGLDIISNVPYGTRRKNTTYLA